MHDYLKFPAFFNLPLRRIAFYAAVTRTSVVVADFGSGNEKWPWYNFYYSVLRIADGYADDGVVARRSLARSSASLGSLGQGRLELFGVNFQFHGGTDVTQFWAIKGKSAAILACAAAAAAAASGRSVGRSCVMSMTDKGDEGKEGRKSSEWTMAWK